MQRYSETLSKPQYHTQKNYKIEEAKNEKEKLRKIKSQKIIWTKCGVGPGERITKPYTETTTMTDKTIKAIPSYKKFY